MEEELKVSEFEYLSNHWSDFPQILNLSSGDQTKINLNMKMTSNGRWPQNIKSWIAQQPSFGASSKDISIHLTLPYSGLRGVLLIFLKVKPVLIKNLSWWSLKKQWKNNSKVGGNSFKRFFPIFLAFSVGLFTIFWLILTKYWQFDEKGGTLTQ